MQKDKKYCKANKLEAAKPGGTSASHSVAIALPQWKESFLATGNAMTRGLSLFVVCALFHYL